MSTRADYTEPEWELLTDLPNLAALGAMAAEQSGPVTSTRELWAGMMELAKAKDTTYQDNALIQGVVRHIAESGDTSHLDIGDLRPSEDLGPHLVEQAQDMARQVDHVLRSRATPEEAAQYRDWIIGIARAAVAGARGGLFGMSGEETTAAEGKYVHDLTAAIGAT
jgi:hypothetical protein